MILCIDTITEFAGVALADGQKCHAYFAFPEKKIAESIIATIEKAMKKARAKLTDLTGVIVIKGPGSFTSLRVGIAVANQLAHQLKIPIVGLRTDEWWMRRTDERPVVYVQSMNREEVYVITGHGVIPSKEGIYPFNLLLDFRLHGNDIGYFGSLSDDHRAKLPSSWHKVDNLKSPKDTWVAAAQALAPQLQSHKAYALIEPFYGKEPTITKSKHSTLQNQGS